MVQIRLIQPKYIILDEIDTGLDIDAFRAIGALLAGLMSTPNPPCIVLITHNLDMAEYLPPDEVYVLSAGQVAHHSAGDSTLALLRTSGFESFDIPSHTTLSNTVSH
jgi:Fe-S cluster assembly ATP-binding protein